MSNQNLEIMIYKNTFENGELKKVKLTANQLAKELISDTIYGMIGAWQEKVACGNDMTEKEQEDVLRALLRKERAINKYLGIER